MAVTEAIGPFTSDVIISCPYAMSYHVQFKQHAQCFGQFWNFTSRLALFVNSILSQNGNNEQMFSFWCRHWGSLRVGCDKCMITSYLTAVRLVCLTDTKIMSTTIGWVWLICLSLPVSFVSLIYLVWPIMHCVEMCNVDMYIIMWYFSIKKTLVDSSSNCVVMPFLCFIKTARTLRL